jgi:5,10-methylenetetrahydromethanopterin reductase
VRVDILLEPDQTPAQLAGLASLCEEAGIQAMWLQNYLSCRDPFMALVPAALATHRVGLGVCIVSPWEMHPVKMANALLTLHEFSNGRAGLVIGGGGEWPARLGIEPVKRVRAVREASELVRAGCSGQALTYRGELFRVFGYRPQFGTGGSPPLVYVGANQPQMVHGTVAAGDGVMYSDMPRQRIAETVRQTLAGLSAKGRSAAGYRVSNIWAWHIKPDRQAARREARRELILRGLLEPWYLEVMLGADQLSLVKRHKKSFYAAYRDRSGDIPDVPEEIIDTLIANLTFTGTPAEIDGRLAELQAFAQAGVGELCFRLHDDPADAIRLIGERIVPALSAAR